MTTRCVLTGGTVNRYIPGFILQICVQRAEKMIAKAEQQALARLGLEVGHGDEPVLGNHSDYAALAGLWFHHYWQCT
jgi:hypothetical protein